MDLYTELYSKLIQFNWSDDFSLIFEPTHIAGLLRTIEMSQKVLLEFALYGCENGIAENNMLNAKLASTLQKSFLSWMTKSYFGYACKWYLLHYCSKNGVLF